jgi:lactate permease
MTLLIASLPIVGSTLAILIFRQSALRAGLFGLLLACFIVLLWPAFRLDIASGSMAVLAGLYNTLNVSYVLLGGVLLFQVLKAGGALDTIARAVAGAITGPHHSLLAIVFGVSVFFESATGFGVGIVVVAPLFLALGYKPLQAAMLALLGQCAVPWGALAVGTVLGADLSGISEERLAEIAVLLGYPYLLLCGIFALVTSGLWRWHVSVLSWLLLYTLVLSASLWIASTAIGVELAGCVAGLVVVLMAVAINWARRRRDRVAGLVAAVTPFVVLMLTLFATRFIAPLSNMLKTQTLQLGDHSLAVFYHPGFWLVVAACSGLLCLPQSRAHVSTISRDSARQWWLATLAVGGFLVFGQLMNAAGMTQLIAQAVIGAAGAHYALVVPFIGGLGGFLTASNAASNALFMTLQTHAATQAGLPVDVIAGAQNAAGSNSSMASPGRLVFAATVAGTPGAEAALLRRILPVAILGVASLALMSLLYLQG